MISLKNWWEQNFQKGTYKKFKVTYNFLRSFIEWKYRKQDVYLNEINHKLIADFEFYLKTEKNQQHNTAMSNIKKLKKIVRVYVANDWLDKDPFKSYKITTKETHRKFLLKEELDTLMTKPITLQRLEQVRDIFVFSCYTGLSYSDVMLLTPHDINIGIDGEQWIFTTRIKTNTGSRIPLLPVPKKILEKYASHPQVIANHVLLPKISNQRLNQAKTIHRTLFKIWNKKSRFVINELINTAIDGEEIPTADANIDKIVVIDTHPISTTDFDFNDDKKGFWFYLGELML